MTATSGQAAGLDIVHVSAKPFSDDHWWRSVSSLDEFCTQAGLPEDFTVFARIMWHDNVDLFQNLLHLADIGAKRWAPSIHGYMNGLSEDRQIHILVELYRLNFSDPLASLPLPQRSQSLCAALGPLIPNQSGEILRSLVLAQAASAFTTQERKAEHSEALPSAGVLADILDRYKTYQNSPMRYVAPYTAVVGPSGIGKSFSMKQIATKHGAYTLYVNVRMDTELGYPPKSSIEVPLRGRWVDLEQEWGHFLQFYVEMVQLARENGITASGLFTLAMEKKYSGFGSETTALLKGGGLEGVSARNSLTDILMRYRQLLEENGDNDHSAGSPSIDIPVILCFDEARALLQSTDDGESSSFKALRSAAKRLSYQPPANLAKFFIVMMDTTSKITNFVPPSMWDPSQKTFNTILLEPIWRLDTWSIFAQARMPEPDGNEAAVSELFRLGRPLWGAFLEAGCTLGDIIGLAIGKLGFDKTTCRPLASIIKDSDARDLALLSTRVNFYVGQASLAERLVSGFLRYVVTIAKDREGLVSTQPREPLLAYAASKILQNLQIRHGAMRTWNASIAGGNVNPGDVGEQVSILMLLFAMDDTLRPAENLPGPVLLSLFWQTLLGNDNWGGLDKALRRRTLKDGRVFFNHFVRLSARPNEAIIREAYCRGQALILPENCPGIDLIIPIQVGGGDAGGESKMGALLVQVKNRANDKLTGSTREYFKSCFKAGLAALPLEAPLPGGYIGLAMCLRCEDGREEYHLSDPAAFKRSAVDFPVVIALGIDVYTLHGQGSQEENGITEIFRRVLQRWPDLYPESELSVPYVDRLIYPFNHFE